MKKFLMLVMILTMALGLSPIPAQANIILDFSLGNTGGGNIYGIPGSGLPFTGLSGANIPVDILTVYGAPGAGTYDTSGTANSDDGNGAAALYFNTTLSSMTFGTQLVPANSILIIGGVDGVAGTLLSGTFSSFNINADGSNVSINGTGIDTKNPALLIALGIPTNTNFRFFQYAATFDYTSTIAHPNGIAQSVDVGNTAVPEPATLLLLGCGLIGLAGFARRRFRK